MAKISEAEWKQVVVNIMEHAPYYLTEFQARNYAEALCDGDCSYYKADYKPQAAIQEEERLGW